MKNTDVPPILTGHPEHATYARADFTNPMTAYNQDKDKQHLTECHLDQEQKTRISAPLEKSREYSTAAEAYNNINKSYKKQNRQHTQHRPTFSVMPLHS